MLDIAHVKYTANSAMDMCLRHDLARRLASEVGLARRGGRVAKNLVHAADGVPAHLPEQGQRGLFEGVLGISSEAIHDPRKSSSSTVKIASYSRFKF